MPESRSRSFTSTPKIRDRMESIAADHRDQLAVWTKDLEALGADRNEVLSVLASLTALAADRALTLMGERMAQFHDTDPAYNAHDAGSLLAQMFLADVLMRARDLSAARDLHG